MDYKSKASYLKGLVEGLNLDESKKETRVFKAIIDFCQNMASGLESLDASCSENRELVYELDEDLGEIEKLVYGCKHSSCIGSKNGCDCGDVHNDGFDDEGDYDECDEYVNVEKVEDDDDEKYEVLCPHCSQVINLENANLKGNEIVCPQCGKELELDFGDSESSKVMDY